MTAENPVVVGVDVGGTKILLGCAIRDGVVLQSRRYPMNKASQADTLESIESALADFLQYRWTGSRPKAIGVGLVGQTDPQAGIWVQAINLPITAPVPLADRWGERYGLPVAMDNDVHAATLAELRLGAGREAQDFIYLNVGTGLAAGLICNGQLVRGAGNYAGELGHMVIEPDGPRCACGMRGCLETLASGGGILDRVVEQLTDYPASDLAPLVARGNLTTDSIFRASEAGDPLAAEVSTRAVRALSLALTTLVNLLNPALIVYGGGVLRDGWMMARVSDFIAAHALPAVRGSLLGIYPSRLNPDLVGLLGATSLAWEHISLNGTIT
jgi:glucokinase